MKRPMGQRLREMYRLETLAAGDTALHRLHPAVKLLGTLSYLICVLSLPASALGQTVSFVLFPVILMALGEIPPGMILGRMAAALPFCLAAGLANLLLDRRAALYLGGFCVTAGMISMLSILLRTVLCVTAVLLLVALTPFSRLTGQLRRAHVPWILVSLLEMTYRYVGTLLDEAGNMTAAYALRAGDHQALEMRHMGSFVGMLLLRSYDRATRVYHAMECRGYGADWAPAEPQPMAPGDWLGLVVLVGGPVALRAVDVPGLLGRWLSCLL